MERITFKAGYGDPTRTIAKKYHDYGSIENLRNEIREINTKLETEIADLKIEKDSLIESFMHLTGLDKAQTEEKIKKLTEQIELKQKEIEHNRDTVRQAWYGFHERL